MNLYRVETCHPETPRMMFDYITVKAASVSQAAEKARERIKRGDGPPEIVRSVIFVEQIDI